MTLTIGATLGHYRVDSLLGQGGMGEVYAAHDDRLNRAVALKLIPENLAANPSSLERFRREAQATAALNHPNIVTVHSIESAGGIHFLTMELVDGHTLESDVRPGGIDTRRLFEIGAAIADAVGAAHDKGIVHRDLKPSNIMVTRDGRVKVLDFGLARLRDAYSEDAVAGETATQASGLTAPHAVIGTAAYMSPEQADGQPTDHRSDIFAIGVILYELASGRRPFRGDSSLAIRSAVAAATPQPLPDVAPGVPRDLWRIVRRALTKDRDRRYQSAKDLRNDLLDAARDLEAGGPSSITPPRPSRGWRAAGFLVVIAASLAGIAALLRDDAPAPRPSVVRFAITEPPAFIPRPEGAYRNVAITRDGSVLAYITDGQATYSGGGRIVLRPLAGRARILETTPNALAPFFSPDGSRMGFRLGSDRYYVTSLSGGTPEPMTESVIAAFTNAAWFGSAGLIYESYGTLFTKPFGGPAEVLARPDESRRETFLYGVSLTQDGRGVLYSLIRDDMKSFDEARVMVKDLATGVAKELIAGGMSPSVTTSGHLLFGRGGTLFAAPVDTRTWALTGPAVPVVEDLLTEPQDGLAPYAVSDNGTLVYIQGRPLPYQREILLFNRRGEPIPSRVPAGAYNELRMSPSGDALALSVYGANVQTWLYDLRRDTLERLTDTWSNEAPEWSHDGTRIAHQSTRGGEPHVYVSGVRERSSETRLASSRLFRLPMSFSSDDAYVIVSDGADLFRLRSDRPADKEVLVATRAVERSPAASPDGRWLAFVADDTGRQEVYVVPYGRPGVRRQISREGAGAPPRWTKRGAELCYRTDQSVECTKIGDDGAAAGALQRILTAQAPFTAWDVSPDGEHFYLLRSDNEGRLATAPIQVVLNWFEELRAKAPVP